MRRNTINKFFSKIGHNNLQQIKNTLFFSLFIVIVSFCSSQFVVSVSAEADPAVLAGILAELAKDDISTGQAPIVIPTTDHIEISLSPTGEIGKPLDLTLRAMTSNGNISSNYRGTIFISALNAPGVTITYKDGYTFTENDKGVKTFLKGISFPKAGAFRIDVSDVSQSNIAGTALITILAPTIETSPVNTNPVNTNPVENNPKPIIVNSAPPSAPINTPKDPKFTITNIATSENRVSITFKVDNEPTTLQKFFITYIDSTGKSNTVTTYDKNRIKKTNGSYTWYIPDLPAKKYTISIAGVDMNGEIISTVASKVFEADLSPKTIDKCIVSDISGIKTIKKNNTVSLVWNAFPGVKGYKVYKRNTNGEYIFIQETKNNSYTIYTTNGNIPNDVFDVKGICVSKAESVKYTPSTRIKTGPSMMIILLIVSMLISGFFIRRRWLQKEW